MSNHRKKNQFILLTLVVIMLGTIVGGGLALMGGGSEYPPDPGVPNNDVLVDNNGDNDYQNNEEEPDVEYDGTRIRLQFAGDVFIHYGPMQVARTGENTFDFRPFLTHIRPFIDGDLSIANMEVPVDAHGNNAGLAGFPLFNSPFEILDGLIYAGFDHLITANNHSFDIGWQGLLNTVANMERAGIPQTGMNINQAAHDTHTIIDVNGIQVGIISYTDSVNGLESLVPDVHRGYAVRRFRSHVMDDVPRMIGDMEQIRAEGAEVVVLALHWGHEYGDAPTAMQQLIAEALSEAGADVIMGKHSHTVHPVRWHERADGNRTLIMYSLGNFLADQTRLFPNATSPNDFLYRGWNSGGGTNFAGRTQFGMLVSLEIFRDVDGNIILETADVLPTLCLRDIRGNTFGQDGVTILPLINGEIPDFVTDEELRAWGRIAYEHVTRIVDAKFITR